MAARRRPGSPWAVVLGIPTMWWIILSGALFNFNMYAVKAFTVAFLARYHQVSLREATWITAWVLGAVGVLAVGFALYLFWSKARAGNRR